MKKIIKAMEQSPLFAGLVDEQLEKLAKQVQPRRYKKEQFIMHQGDFASGIGLVTEGKVHIIREDFFGNREILATAETGEIFGEVYGILPDEPQRVTVIAATDCKAVFFSMECLMRDRTAHQILMKNLLQVVARKNLFLTGKMLHLSKRSIREKVISYLSEEAERQGSNTISIPFNRQQLADYLAAERSALSRELSRMKTEGIIDFCKNQFELK